MSAKGPRTSDPARGVDADVNQGSDCEGHEPSGRRLNGEGNRSTSQEEDGDTGFRLDEDVHSNPQHTVADSDESLRKKREMNIIYSRRKRAKKKRQEQEIRDHKSDLEVENKRLKAENARLQHLVKQAQEFVDHHLEMGLSSSSSGLPPSSSGNRMHAQVGLSGTSVGQGVLLPGRGIGQATSSSLLLQQRGAANDPASNVQNLVHLLGASQVGATASPSLASLGGSTGFNPQCNMTTATASLGSGGVSTTHTSSLTSAASFHTASATNDPLLGSRNHFLAQNLSSQLYQQREQQLLQHSMQLQLSQNVMQHNLLQRTTNLGTGNSIIPQSLLRGAASLQTNRTGQFTLVGQTVLPSTLTSSQQHHQAQTAASSVSGNVGYGQASSMPSSIDGNNDISRNMVLAQLLQQQQARQQPAQSSGSKNGLPGSFSNSNNSNQSQR